MFVNMSNWSGKIVFQGREKPVGLIYSVNTEITNHMDLSCFKMRDASNTVGYSLSLGEYNLWSGRNC